MRDEIYFNDGACSCASLFCRGCDDPQAFPTVVNAMASWTAPSMGLCSTPQRPKPNFFPLPNEIDDWQKHRTTDTWDKRTGGMVTNGDFRAGFMDIASEMYQLVQIVQMLMNSVQSTNVPPSRGGGSKPEKCYWCAGQRMIGSPCPTCGRP